MGHKGKRVKKTAKKKSILIVWGRKSAPGTDGAASTTVPVGTSVVKLPAGYVPVVRNGISGLDLDTLAHYARIQGATPSIASN